MDNAPIILTGRGGSGTRLLSDIVGYSGVFLGNDLNKSSDSVEWVDLIYKIAIETVGQGGAAPTNWSDQLQQRAQNILTKAQADLGAWGLKLPETILILPQLLQAFPHAKIVHLVRHPVDSSLRRTHMTSRMNNPIGRAVLSAAYSCLGRSIDDIRCDEDYLRNAITWDYQLRQAMDFAQTDLPKDQYLEVRYEDICADPQGSADAIQKFLGFQAVKINLPNIDTARTGDYASDDPRIAKVWDICGETAQRLGYRLDET